MNVYSSGAIAAQRHAGRRVVTVVMDSTRFLSPVHVSDLVTVSARVTAVWHTSLETAVTVEAENLLTGERRHTASAFLVYCVLDEAERPAHVPPLLLETDADRALARDAEARRQQRLAGGAER